MFETSPFFHRKLPFPICDKFHIAFKENGTSAASVREVIVSGDSEIGNTTFVSVGYLNVPDAGIR